MNKLILRSVVLFLSVLGCAIGPDYRRPAVEAPPNWRFASDEAKDLANTAWWEQFNDPVLNSLIETALKENKDVKIAAARIEEFLGRYWSARSSLFPQVNATGDAGRARVSETGTSPVPDGVRNPAGFYNTALNGSWEIDIWGRLRRVSEAARAELLATGEGKRAVILTLVASVANAYINLRDLDEQLDVAKRTAKSREDAYALFMLRFEGGLISDLELSQARSEYEQAASTVPAIERAIAQQENALSVLLGKNPGPIERGKPIDDLVLPAVPAGIPSDLLERRPDVRQAEQDLIAANARIGAARGLYFPSISLTGSYGWSSADLSRLVRDASEAWNWSGSFTAPIFTGGSIKGQVKAAEAVQQQALFRYQQTIQTAFREVEDALADQNRTRAELESQRRQVEALQNYAQVARLRYDNGYTSYIEVLDAERSLFNAQLAYLKTQGALFQALVNLYKAMGGGWVVEAERMTAEQAAADR
jgi:multidrug efflux system outer membrane protein